MPEAFVLLAEAPNQLVAEMWQELLQNEGIESFIAPADAVSFLGVTALPCRLMVAPADLARAHQILDSLAPATNGPELTDEEDGG